MLRRILVIGVTSNFASVLFILSFQETLYLFFRFSLLNSLSSVQRTIRCRDHFSVENIYKTMFTLSTYFTEFFLASILQQRSLKRVFTISRLSSAVHIGYTIVSNYCRKIPTIFLEFSIDISHNDMPIQIVDNLFTIVNNTSSPGITGDRGLIL